MVVEYTYHVKNLRVDPLRVDAKKLGVSPGKHME